MGVMSDDRVENSDDGLARAVIASSPNAVVAVDRDLTVLTWNPAAERVFGWTAAEMMGRRAPLVPEELMAEHNAVLERARTGAQVSLRTKRPRDDGSTVDVGVDISALRSEAGALLGYVSVYHPVELDAAARDRGARRARLVRRLTDVVGDINAELELSPCSTASPRA